MKNSLTNYDDFSDIYDYQYINHHANSGDIDFYNSSCKNPDESILEIACGTGRISLGLAKKGKNLVSLDNSIKMLEKAKVKLQAESNEIRRRIEFIHADMRTFDLNRTFDLAFIGFRSFMLVHSNDDQKSTLFSLNKHLNQGGILIISMWVPTISLLSSYHKSEEDCEQFEFYSKFPHPNGKDEIWEFQKKWVDEFNQIAFHRLKHITYSADGSEIETKYRDLNMRWIHRFEFQNLVQYCGFTVQNIYSDYLGSDFDSKSREMIWILKKGN